MRRLHQDTLSRIQAQQASRAQPITDKVLGEMVSWSSRPLQQIYAAIFIDASI